MARPSRSISARSRHSERVLGKEHPDTLTSLGNDAGLLTAAADRRPGPIEPMTAPGRWIGRWLMVDKPGDAAYSLESHESLLSTKHESPGNFNKRHSISRSRRHFHREENQR